MRSLTLPRLRWQPRSNPGDIPMQSLSIAALRGLAAVQVAAAHLRAEIYPGLRTIEDPSLAYLGLAFLTGFAHQAVVVFFLISGWLVGGSLLNRLHQPQALAHYVIDRITRLWTVLVPTLLLVLAIGLALGKVRPGPIDFSPANEYSALNFLANLLGLQTVLLPDYGGNYPLWSLAYETWYYVQFPLLALLVLGHGRWRRAACGAALAVVVATLPKLVTAYFLIWLLGAAFSRVRLDCGAGWRAFLLLLSVGLFTYYRLTGSNDDLVPESFFQDLICSIPLLLWLTSLQQQVDTGSQGFRRASAVAHFFSEFSFTLYVIHVPLIFLLRHIGQESLGRQRLDPRLATDFLWYGGLLLFLIVTAYGFYLLFERHTVRVRRFLKRMLLEPRSARRPVSAMSPD